LAKIIPVCTKRHSGNYYATIDKTVTIDTIEKETEQETHDEDRDKSEHGVEDGPGISGGAEAGVSGTNAEVRDTGELPDREGEGGVGDGEGTEEAGTAEGRPDRGDKEALPDSTAGPELPSGRPEGAAGGRKETSGTVQGKATTHRIEPGDVIAPRGAITQIRTNIRAIKLLKKLEFKNLRE